jgi:histidinol phosphatase-like PHP family hydrolase
MEATEQIVRAGVHILAHPFRYFRGGTVERPRHLYRPLARLLAETGVAAEINFHKYRPDPAFFALCLEEGVRIALGSDSHSLWEPGELWPHLDLLRQAGCSHGYERVLFTP